MLELIKMCIYIEMSAPCFLRNQPREYIMDHVPHLDFDAKLDGVIFHDGIKEERIIWAPRMQKNELEAVIVAESYLQQPLTCGEYEAYSDKSLYPNFVLWGISRFTLLGKKIRYNRTKVWEGNRVYLKIETTE